VKYIYQVHSLVHQQTVMEDYLKSKLNKEYIANFLTGILYFSHTSDANASLLFSPPEIPFAKSPIPILVSWHLYKLSLKIHNFF
jgi:hypothetical protein